MRNRFFKILTLLFVLSALSACENYLGEETDLSFIEVPQQSYREVAYVPVQPILNQFVYPTDVIAGFDELIYVVDAGSEEIIALDESGRELARMRIQGAKGIAQDRSLDLLVIGTKRDTTPTGKIVDRSCLYRLDLTQDAGYGLQYAQIVNSIMHPFYFKSSSISRDEQVFFNRVSVLGDNTYYVTRSGPNNDPNQAGGPDDAILFFNRDDVYVTPVIVSNAQGGIFNNYFKQPFAISTLAKPPQLSVDLRGDFVYTSMDDNAVLKVQYIENQSSEDGSIYLPKIDWSNDTSLADNFITEPYRFSEPSGIEFAGGGSNYIFVVDKLKDSLYQFTATGLEGVQPPPASGETKFVKTSFGGTGQGPNNFNEPMGVAFKDEVLYVADAGNGRLLRFKLTLDIE